ncbi:hypothetical protein BGX31_006448 [Mortierella sp. GBA43]|nr:hypothetical protein BGX31_006448 [Mortierella sp. GBA43]
MSHNKRVHVFLGDDDDEEYQYHTSEDDDGEEGQEVGDNGDDDGNNDDDDDEEGDDDYEDVEDDEDDEDDDMGGGQFLFPGNLGLRQIFALLQARHQQVPPRRARRSPSPIPEPDKEKGQEVLNTGEFGRVDSACVPSWEKRNFTQRLWKRQLRPWSVDPVSIGETLLPNDPGKVIDVYDDSAYSGQYSEDGSLFATCDKDFKLRIYKTAGDKLTCDKVIQGPEGSWTITDHNLSLDNHWLIYSSLNPYVYLTRTEPDAPGDHHMLDFSSSTGSDALWSVRFSGDGREIIAGGRGRIYVYDIESRTVIHSVKAHDNDVNAVCFAEPSSSQVLFSGSDDRLVKVWDRRSMGNGRGSSPSGILVGHSEGITYVTSKGDNRYLASNGKDQKMLLWDLRQMYSRKKYAELPEIPYTGFDYRRGQYPGSKSNKVKRYLYTGSADGKVYIYRLDGTLVRTLDTCAAFQRQTKEDQPPAYMVRDASWHPYYPTIISSCATGLYSHQTLDGGIVQHSFNSKRDLESELSDASDSDILPLPRRQRRRWYI